MSDNTDLIWKKIAHMHRMRAYLSYSLAQTLLIIPISDWHSLTPPQHETLAAFRIRFSEFQEHLGKIMRAIAREEDQATEPFSFVLHYMEKLSILDAAEQWKVIRELRNAVNHEYEESEQRLNEFFLALTGAVPDLYTWFDRTLAFCEASYPQKP